LIYGTYIAYPTDDQEKQLKAFLETQSIPFITEETDDVLPPHVLEGIARGQADIEADRFISLEEFKRKYPG
jgi:hypothetical protein